MKNQGCGCAFVVGAESHLAGCGLAAAAAAAEWPPALTRGAVRPYRGFPVRCGWCCYDGQWGRNDGPIEPCAPATHVIVTAKGERQVCETHASRGTWGRRARRVGAVA